ncbi:hypothetical protein [Xanthomonas oryzae]|uniref:hypothetical protein n=1 Tax=Xanthomonas oryzae TaxID=347 RepID=UPI003D057D52
MPNNAVNQVVKAAVGEVPRALHFDDLQRIGHTVAQTIEREPGIGLLMLSAADGRASTEQSSLDVDGRRLAALAEVIATLDRLGWHAVPDLAATAPPRYRNVFHAKRCFLPCQNIGARRCRRWNPAMRCNCASGQS